MFVYSSLIIFPCLTAYTMNRQQRGLSSLHKSKIRENSKQNQINLLGRLKLVKVKQIRWHLSGGVYYTMRVFKCIVRHALHS